MMSELLPCPFCGAEPKWFNNVSGIRTVEWCIECLGCAVVTQDSTNKNYVKKVWNRRVLPKKVSE